MPKPNYLPEFESQMRKAMDVPDPDANKLDALREQFVALGVASLQTDHLPDPASKPSRPEKEPKMKRTTLLSSSRLAWGLALLALAILLVFAFSSPKIVNALQRLFGYIPGLGVVDQNAAFYVLAEPVSQTRDDVTVTVEKAIMSEDDILLTYKVEGLTSDKFSFLEPLDTCMSQEELRFPGGESVKLSSGVSSMPFENGFETTNKYGPIPGRATNVTFLIPCINGALSPGILPENWEVPLHFVPASPDVDLTMMPVLDVSSPAPVTMPAIETASPPMAGATPSAPLTLTRIIDAGDTSTQYGEGYKQSYILFGELSPPAPFQSGEWRIDWVNLDMVDNTGQRVYWQVPNDIDWPSSNSPHKIVWAIIVPEFVPPLRIIQTARYAISANSQETYEFEFDAGTNPQPLQEWNLNMEFVFAGHSVQLTRIVASPVRTGYIFSFETDDNNISSLSVKIDSYPSIEDLLIPILLTGRNGNMWDIYKYYPESLPAGKLKVILSDLYLVGETKDWTIDWQP